MAFKLSCAASTFLVSRQISLLKQYRSMSIVTDFYHILLEKLPQDYCGSGVLASMWLANWTLPFAL